MSLDLKSGLKGLKPYEPNHQCYRIKMDANENPYDLPMTVRKQLATELLEGSRLNIYPDSDANQLRETIATINNLDKGCIMTGSGSDELIQIIINAFVDKGDRVLCPTPSFSMYGIFTRIAGGLAVEYELNHDFSYNTEMILNKADENKAGIIFLCSPNNPTGNIIPREEIISILEGFDGLVVLDEAYGDFSGKTMIDSILDYSNLVILKTFSKAMGLAGLRIGYMAADRNLIRQMSIVKPPYNLNSFSQRAAILLLDQMKTVNDRINNIVEQREYLTNSLKTIEKVRVFPSQANFILIGVPDASYCFSELLEKGILVRHYIGHPMLDNCLRITVGFREDNQYLIDSLKDILD